MNAMVKGEDGAIGLTESPDAFERCMTAGPGVARHDRQFEESKTSLSVTLGSDITSRQRPTNDGFKLYVRCQARGGYLSEFFKHENQSLPPSLSDSGDLQQGNKADVLRCFQRSHDHVVSEPKVLAVVIDGQP